MPAGAEWAWVEAYGNGHLEPQTSHGADWDAAVAHASERLEQLLPPHEELEAMLPAAISNADIPPSKMLLHGSGWGVVERARRDRSGMAWIDESGTPFVDESATAEQEPWLGLLHGKAFDGAPPVSLRGADWEDLLAGQDSPEAKLHLATMKHARQDLGGANALYREVLAARDVTPGTKRSRTVVWAWHCLQRDRKCRVWLSFGTA